MWPVMVRSSALASQLHIYARIVEKHMEMATSLPAPFISIGLSGCLPVRRSRGPASGVGTLGCTSKSTYQHQRKHNSRAKMRGIRNQYGEIPPAGQLCAVLLCNFWRASMLAAPAIAPHLNHNLQPRASRLI
jgi:hypothetical protein